MILGIVTFCFIIRESADLGFNCVCVCVGWEGGGVALSGFWSLFNNILETKFSILVDPACKNHHDKTIQYAIFGSWQLD